MKKYKNGFMLMEIIISFLIVSISLGVIFQSIATSMSSWAKGKQKILRAFQLEYAGTLIFLQPQESRELGSIYVRHMPFEIQDHVYELLEINVDNREKTCLFLKGE